MNPLFQKLRQNQHKQIRRQFIETYQRNKRKQFFSNHQTSASFDHLENQHQAYLDSLTEKQFASNPNDHLTFLRDIICSNKNSSYVRSKLAEIIILVYEYLKKAIGEARVRINLLESLLREDEYVKEQNLMSMIICSILVYNQIFYEPLSNIKQLYFMQSNPYNPLQTQSIEQNILHNQELQNKKLNIYVFFEFIIAITYELTPREFANQRKNKVNAFNVLDNGYGQLLLNKQQPLHKEKQESQEMKLFITILNDLYQLSNDIFKLALNIRYLTASLAQLWNYLKKIYTHSHTLKSDYSQTVLPTLWFDHEKMLVKQSVKTRITLRILQFFVNMTFCVGQNPQYDKFLFSLSMLNSFEQISNDLPLQKEEVLKITELYGNLVEEEINWVRTRSISIYQNKIHEEQDDEGCYLRQPGVYINLVQLITGYAQTCKQIDQILYIIKIIIEEYEIPSKTLQISGSQHSEDLKDGILVLYQTDCETISSQLSSLFYILDEKQFQSQFLSEVFVVVCKKLLPYLYYMHQLDSVLKLVIRNQNKRILQLEEAKVRYKENKYKQPNNLLLQQTVDSANKQKRIITQNLVQIIKQSCKLLHVFRKQIDLFENFQVNKEVLMSFDRDYISVARGFVNSIISFWEENQLEHCYDQFIQFVDTAVVLFPDFLIMHQDSTVNAKFIMLLEELFTSCEQFQLQDKAISLLQHTISYVCHLNIKIQQSQRLKIRRYFVDFKDQWQDILQNLQGLMISKEKNKKQFTNRVQAIYQIVNKTLNNSLENMDVQI